jgi:hypothetical protein
LQTLPQNIPQLIKTGSQFNQGYTAVYCFKINCNSFKILSMKYLKWYVSTNYLFHILLNVQFYYEFNEQLML